MRPVRDGDEARIEVGCFLCSDPAGCASLGAFRDGQYALIGRYRVPEEALAEPER